MLTSTRSFRIEWGDCDPADIVYYPRYFAMFDTSTANHFREAGLPKPDLLRLYDVVGFPMVDTRAQFHSPSTHGDLVTIETRIVRFGRSSFEVEHKLINAGKLAVEGFEKRVLVGRGPDGTGIVSCPIPQDVRALFERGDSVPPAD